MGPTRVDPVAQARVIVRHCLEQCLEREIAAARHAEPAVAPTIVYDFGPERRDGHDSQSGHDSAGASPDEGYRLTPPLTGQACSVAVLAILACAVLCAWFVSRALAWP
jgi:hypothetical protein